MIKKKLIWPEQTKKAICILLVARPDLKEFFKKRAFSHVTTSRELIELWLLQERKCALCGDMLSMDINTHVDHIIPKSKGGKDTIENYQLVCSTCNYSKRDLTTKDFLLLCLKISANHQSTFISREEKMEILQEKWKRENRERNDINRGVNDKDTLKLEYLLNKKIKNKSEDSDYLRKLLASAGLIQNSAY